VPRVTLRDAGGAEVANSDGAEGLLTVPDVHAWAPGDGYLHQLEATLHVPGGGLVDSYTLPVGCAHRGGGRH
jgi:beta-glucuronidase